MNICKYNFPLCMFLFKKEKNYLKIECDVIRDCIHSSNEEDIYKCLCINYVLEWHNHSWIPEIK